MIAGATRSTFVRWCTFQAAQASVACALGDGFEPLLAIVNVIRRGAARQPCSGAQWR